MNRSTGPSAIAHRWDQRLVSAVRCRLPARQPVSPRWLLLDGAALVRKTHPFDSGVFSGRFERW